MMRDGLLVRSLIIIVGLLAIAILSACVPMNLQKDAVALEQRALRSAITLCSKFGHTEGTKEFTRCAEQRYDEYLLNNR